MSRWPSSPGNGLQNREGECNSHMGLQFFLFVAAEVTRLILNPWHLTLDTSPFAVQSLVTSAATRLTFNFGSTMPSDKPV
jgi:hypothetical protein